MNNSSNSRKNIPAFVAGTADDSKSVLLQAREVIALGVKLEVEDYSDGYIGITNTAFDGMVAGVDRLHYLGETRGLFTALATLKDSKGGDFLHGFHCPEGIMNVLRTTRDEKKDHMGRTIPRAYVNWNIFLNPLYAEQNAGMIALLAQFGIEKEDEGGRWVAIGARNNRIFRAYVNAPRKFNEFAAWANDYYGYEIDWKSDDGKAKIKNIFDHEWNTQHRHDGFETLLHVVEGSTRIGIKFRAFADDTNPEFTFQKWTDMLTKHYLSLWTESAEDRAARKSKEQEEGKLRDVMTARAVVIATNDGYTPSANVEKVVKKDRVVIFKAAGETESVSAASLVGKKFVVVAADGSNITNAAVPMLTEIKVVAAVSMAADRFHGLVKIVS